MLARDFLHLAALYEHFLNSAQAPETTGPAKLVAEELTAEDEPVAAVPFQEWLFAVDAAE